MIGSIRDSWELLLGEVWERLATSGDLQGGPPPDLYGDLFGAAEERLSPRPTRSELEATRNDPEAARTRFLALRGTDFLSEGAIVGFLEDASTVVADYDIPGFEVRYRTLLAGFFDKYNLKYRVDEPFRIVVLLTGSFTSLYQELARLNEADQHVLRLWRDFESGFDQYVRSQDDADLRTSIGRASNYLEGLAGATSGTPGTLGALCDSLTDWPHQKVKDAVKNLYGFCSDYPGIRHGGRPASRLRDLDARDSVAINVALLALASYLARDPDVQAVLGTAAGASTPLSGRRNAALRPARLGASNRPFAQRLRDWLGLPAATRR